MRKHIAFETSAARAGGLTANRGDDHIHDGVGIAFLEGLVKQMRIGVEGIHHGRFEIARRYAVAMAHDIDGAVVGPFFLQLKNDVTVNDILVDGLKFEVSRIGKADQMRVATCLRSLDWVKVGNVKAYGKVRKVWRRKEA